MLGIKNISVGTSDASVPTVPKPYKTKELNESKKQRRTRAPHAINHYTEEEIKFILQNLGNGVTSLAESPFLLKRHSAASITGYATMMQRNSKALPKSIQRMIAMQRPMLSSYNGSPTTPENTTKTSYVQPYVQPVYERMTEDQA